MTSFDIADPLALGPDLAPDQSAVMERVGVFVDADLLPAIGGLFEEGRFPREFVSPIARLGLLGGPLKTHGCPGWDAATYGLAMMELERGDSGVRSFASVQGALVMWPLATYGSPEQQDRWLPALAKGEAIGCFGLTEPGSGSDPASLTTHARRDGSDWVLTGVKRWLTNGPVADVALVWAKAEGEGEGAQAVRGFLVELPARGAEMVSIPHRMSLRASASGQLSLDAVRVPGSAMLPGVRGLKGPLSCLQQARYGIAWGVTGAHAACLGAARDHTVRRVQFGRPLAARQLVQQKLGEMLSSLGHAQLLAMRLARLKDEGRL
ncbi:MAG: hypothetical protein RL199_1398, partial [Pseudomonadota bacterium]